MLTSTGSSIWLQVYSISNIDHPEFYSLLLDCLLFLHFIFQAFLVNSFSVTQKLPFLPFALDLRIPNRNQFQIQHGLQSPFVSLIVLTEGFLRYLRAMLGDA